jgi:26S proteasome regulatory subunit N13
MYKRAPQSSRVFLLEFKDTSRKLFFWMQEPKDDKDEDFLTKINQYINNPPALDASMFE